MKTHCVLPAIFAAALVLAAPVAQAERFDGGWSMVAKTTRGHCGVIQVGLSVNRGRISSTGGSFAFYPINVGGRVTANGRASLKAVAGPRTAHGTGSFRRAQATGTWKGRGPSGLCSGVWTAKRV
jgi:hypothetical protein